jgi:hypothetical protein
MLSASRRGFLRFAKFKFFVLDNESCAGLKSMVVVFAFWIYVIAVFTSHEYFACRKMVVPCFFVPLPRRVILMVRE